jgi:hypothetical protein
MRIARADVVGIRKAAAITGKDHLVTTPQRGQTHICELDDLPEQKFFCQHILFY